MHEDTQLISWPCLLQQAGDAELVYVDDQAAWVADAGLQDANYNAEDRLIDARGQLFSLTQRRDGVIQPKPLGDTLSLHDILGLVKAHAAQSGSCCVAKLYAPTIGAAFAIVNSLDTT